MYVISIEPRYGRTDRRTTYDSNTALRMYVLHAVKRQHFKRVCRLFFRCYYYLLLLLLIVHTMCFVIVLLNGDA